MTEIGARGCMHPLDANASLPRGGEVHPCGENQGRVDLAATNTEIGAIDQLPATQARDNVPRGGEVQRACENQNTPDLAATTTEIGAISAVHPLDAKHWLPRGGEVHLAGENHRSPDLAATILELRRAQQKRRYCITSQSMLDRRLEHLIVEGWGYHTGQTEAERKKLFERAAALRTAIERDKAIPDYSDNTLADDLPLLIKISAQARSPFDDMRDAIEARMIKLAKTLPVWPFVANVRGFSDKFLAIIVGEAPGTEAGGLGDFATKERLWKRLGLAVINGRRQGNPKANLPADWIEHGYKKSRRSEIWVIGTILFRAQWRGEKDGVPAHAIGPYGEVYAARRAHTAGRIEATAHLPPKHPDKWTLGRCYNDAVRIMTKQLVADLWRAWRGATTSLQTTALAPRAAVQPVPPALPFEPPELASAP